MKRRLTVTNLSSENNLPMFRLNTSVVIMAKIYCYCTYRHMTREALCVCAGLSACQVGVFLKGISQLSKICPPPPSRSHYPWVCLWEINFCTCEICCLDRDFSSARDKNLLSCSQIARSSAKQATSCSLMSLAPVDWARALFICKTWVSSMWGRVRRELSEIHLPCTHIWTRCITRRVVASQPSLAAMSTRDYSDKNSWIKFTLNQLGCHMHWHC